MLAVTLVAFAATTAAQTRTIGGPYEGQGPAPQTGGQIDGMSAQSSPVSGAVEALAAHPTDADTLLAGSVNGGIWRTTDATMSSPSWTNVSDTGSIADIKYDLSDGTSMTLIAGIGRTSAYAGLGGDRAGLLRSTDGGASWSAISTLAGGPNARAVEARGANLVAAVNIADSFTCSNIGVFHSSDTGATFTQRLRGQSYDVAANPLTTGTGTTELFANLYTFGGACAGPLAVDGIHKSSDSGATWTKVSSAAMDAQLSVGPANVQISVGRQGTGAAANAYVGICNSGGQLASVWRSGDGGATWTSLPIPATSTVTPVGIHPGTQCGTHFSLQADWTNHNVVYMGGDRQPDGLEEGGAMQFPNSFGSTNYSGQLHRVDATTTLTAPLTHCLSATPASCPTASTTAGATGSAPHADSRDMAIDANGNLLESDDGGIYRRTVPLGAGDWFGVVGDLGVIEQHDGAYDTIADSIIGGQQDNGSSFRDGSTLRAPGSWSTLNGGDGGDVTVDANTAGTSSRYSSSQNLGGFTRRTYNTSNVLQATFSPALAGIPAITPQFVTPIAASTTTAGGLVIGGGDPDTMTANDGGVYESTDFGATVTLILPDVVINRFPSSGITYGHPLNASFLAFGDNAGNVYTRTGAVLTTPTATTDPDGGSSSGIVEVVVDPGNISRMVALSETNVYETTNGGTSWSDVTGNLAALGAGTLYSAEFLRNDGNSAVGLAIGATNGVFIDTDAATRAFGTYEQFGTSLGKAPVLDIQYDPADDNLLVATLGRGSYTLNPVLALVPVELMTFEVE